MQIDPHDPSLITLAEAARRLPGRPHVSTLHRWRQRGVQGVTLETIRIGGRRFTSREAIERFSERITAVANGDPSPQRTNRQRAAAISQAERELGRDGI